MALTLLLKCNDLEVTRSYYASALGFTVTDGAQGSITAEKEGARLIFTAEDLWKRESGCSGTIYIGVKDVDGFYEAVAGKAEVAWPL
jgi:catechol-2,3-dioxygenase